MDIIRESFMCGQLSLKPSKHWVPFPLLLKEWRIVQWASLKEWDRRIGMLCWLDSSAQRISASLKVWEPDPNLLKECPIAGLLIVVWVKSCDLSLKLLKEWRLGRREMVVVVTEGVETPLVAPRLSLLPHAMLSNSLVLYGYGFS